MGIGFCLEPQSCIEEVGGQYFPVELGNSCTLDNGDPGICNGGTCELGLWVYDGPAADQERLVLLDTCQGMLIELSRTDG